MKTQAMLLGMLLVTVGSSFAQGMAQAPVVEEAAVVEVGNKICPVSGEKIGGMGDVVKVTHQGKVYNLCCQMCKKDFTNNPDKYVKIAEDEVALQVKEVE